MDGLKLLPDTAEEISLHFRATLSRGDFFPLYSFPSFLPSFLPPSLPLLHLPCSIDSGGRESNGVGKRKTDLYLTVSSRYSA